MNISCSVRLNLLCEVLILVLINVEGRKYNISKRLVCGASPETLLKTIWRISESACVDECRRRPSCKSLDYSGRFKLCNLYSEEDIKLVKGHCVYLKRTDIVSESTCNNNCLDGEVCDATTMECIILECKPLVVEGSLFLGNLNNIGNIKKEIRHNQFGNYTIPLPVTCQADGTWHHQLSLVGPYNVAFGKTVTLSTIFAPDGSTGNLMVNGDISGSWFCACTSYEQKPWAMVDLGENHLLFAFTIFNRRNCCAQRLHDLEIYVGESMDSLHLCTEHPGVLDPVVETMVLTTAFIGRYVKLQIVGEPIWYYDIEYGDNMLTICELQVYGNPIIV